MRNNRGFISISIVYSFFLVFIALVIGIVTLYSSRRSLLNKVKDDVRNNIYVYESSKYLGYNILNNEEKINDMVPYSQNYMEVDWDLPLYNNTKYYWGTMSVFDENTGKYKLVENKNNSLVQATVSECRNHTVYCGDLTLASDDKDYSSYILYRVDRSYEGLYNEDSGSTVYVNLDAEMTANNFYSSNSSDVPYGLYKTNDDYGETYFYRGFVSNNYVKFGTYAEDYTMTTFDYDWWEDTEVTIEAGTPMYWRILRINGDGTIRMIYDGTTAASDSYFNVNSIGQSLYSRSSTNIDNINYSNSLIQSYVEAWYVTNLKNTYGKFIADSMFCTDREVLEENSEGTRYAFHSRLDRNASLVCNNESDELTVENSELKYPVGLITADEVNLAGLDVTYTGNYSFLYGNYWTMTPAEYINNGTDVGAGVWYVDGTYLYDSDQFADYVFVDTEAKEVRPVINLKADVEIVSGDGTLNDPYIINVPEDVS